MGKPGPNQRQSDADLLRLIVLHPDPVVTAKDVADKTGYSRAAVNNRFDDLVADGLLEKKSVGARAAVYWPTRDGRQLVRD